MVLFTPPDDWRENNRVSRYVISTDSVETNFRTVLSARLDCNPDSGTDEECVAAPEGSSGAWLTRRSRDGAIYIVVQGYDGAEGDFELSVEAIR